MSNTSENRKAALVGEAAGLASSDAGSEQDRAALDGFVRAFYEHVPPADVVSHTASDLSDAARSIWRLAADRPGGQPRIRVGSPDAHDARAGERGIVQIVNDDMCSSSTASPPPSPVSGSTFA